MKYDYNDGKWHAWGGGERPVSKDTVLDIVMVDGDKYSGVTATSFSWHHRYGNANVVSFRVVRTCIKPREYWVFTNGHGDLCVSSTWRNDATHVREVTE